jgi:hypothetical protein
MVKGALRPGHCYIFFFILRCPFILSDSMQSFESVYENLKRFGTWVGGWVTVTKGAEILATSGHFFCHDSTLKFTGTYLRILRKI